MQCLRHRVVRQDAPCKTAVPREVRKAATSRRTPKHCALVRQDAPYGGFAAPAIFRMGLDEKWRGCCGRMDGAIRAFEVALQGGVAGASAPREMGSPLSSLAIRVGMLVPLGGVYPSRRARLRDGSARGPVALRLNERGGSPATIGCRGQGKTCGYLVGGLGSLVMGPRLRFGLVFICRWPKNVF